MGTQRCLKTSFAGSVRRTSSLASMVVEVDDGHGKLLADRFEDLRGVDVAQPDEHLVQPFAGALLLRDGLL
jgi:hypothetical protein